MNRNALKSTVIYAGLATVWAIFSNYFVATLKPGHEQYLLDDMLKGWFFVFITSVLFFLITRYSHKEILRSHKELETAYETLTATEEEVRHQFDELLTKEELLRTSEERYRSLFENMSDAFALHEMIFDAGGKPADYRFLAVNPAFEALTGLKQNTVLNRTVLEVLPDTERHWIETYGRVVTTGLPEIFTNYSHALNRHFMVRAYHSDSNQFAVIFQDITERRQREATLYLIEQVFNNTTEGVIITNKDRIIQSVNQAFTDITGYSAREAIGSTPKILGSGINAPVIYEEMWQSLRSTGKWKGELWNRRKNGELYPEWLTMCAIADNNGTVTHYAAIFTDITEHKRDEETIARLAFYDALTGLPNRTLFADRLATAIAHAHRNKEKLALFLLDLDQFKAINDTLGHAAGDELLKDVAARLKQCAREDDTFARMGGDEFAILMPDIDQVQAPLSLAYCILSACQTPWQINEHQFRLTASIGIAIYPDDGDTAEQLMKSADIAMYRAKESGKNTYQLYASGMNKLALERLQLEADLRRALKEDQFVLYYQPQIDTQSGYMVGVEALVRWYHPERGMVSPAQFIPLAEETGLIIPIGEWVLHTVCTQLKTWQSRGLPPVRVSVNLSARQFQEKNLLDMVTRTLGATGISPDSLELEITESIALQDVDYTVTTLNVLKDMGIQIALDDFGTGYSSLIYLKRFPIDALKIDQSFVRDISTDSDDAAIVSAIIGLAKSLKLRVIAEGVETADQIAFLRRHHCYTMQGYYFSRPVPPAEFEHFLTGKCDL